MDSEVLLRNKPFSHIYVEKRVMEDKEYSEKAKEIIGHFPEAVVIEIEHYKDVFNRHKQCFSEQHESQALVLAVKQGNLVYPGAAVCQSMGNEHFYYTSCMMNCLFDCEYCYLKGMYPSGNMVVFLNLRDIFNRVKELLREHPVYLCVSYDTDLLAAEALTGYVKEWMKFTDSNPGLTIEVRTKAGNIEFERLLLTPLQRNESVIFAFTLSPEYVITHYEHRTGSLKGRIDSIKKALECGLSVRLCFDPMIYCPDWKKEYGIMMDTVLSEIPMDKIRDVSVGSFRLSEDYLKTMRRNMPGSAVVQYPYQNDGGVYHYSHKLTSDMESWMVSRLREYVPEARIFRWGEE